MLDLPTSAGVDRKADHLRIVAGSGVQHWLESGLRAVHLTHRALPERDLEHVDLTSVLFGAELRAPVLISAMTGGLPEAEAINRRLLDAAAAHGIGIALGSGRRLLADRGLLSSFRPSRSGRPPLLLANLGAVQLAQPGGSRDAARLVEMLGADGLTVHLNALQEAVQPEGQARYAGITDAIAETVAALAPLPVVVKEVGFGLSAADIARLHGARVAGIDVAGAGGTNWALVEGQRDSFAGRVADGFGDWGNSTVDSLRAARNSVFAGAVIASGGVHDGVDCAKCLALGADACAVARPMLLAALADELDAGVTVLCHQLRIAVWLTGAGSAADIDLSCLR